METIQVLKPVNKYLSPKHCVILKLANNMLHLQHFTTARLQAMTLKLELVKLIVWFVSKKIKLKINNNNNTVKPHLWTTSVIQSPRYYGHFFYACLAKSAIHFHVIIIIWLTFFGPLVTVLMGCHCTRMLIKIKGYWATCISGKAPPSPKSWRSKQCKQFQKQILLFQRMGRENKHNNMGLCPLDFLS